MAISTNVKHKATVIIAEEPGWVMARAFGQTLEVTRSWLLQDHDKYFLPVSRYILKKGMELIDATEWSNDGYMIGLSRTETYRERDLVEEVA